MAMTTVNELRASLEHGQRPLLVDVRSASEFAAGHVPGSVSMPMEEAESRLEDIPKDAPVVLLCQSGSRAGMVCELIQHERPNASVLDGGVDAWELAKMPLVSTRRTRWSIERQVRLTAGLLVLIGTVFSMILAPGWIYVAMFIGAGLTFSGLTNFCGMAALYALMPWNKPKKPEGASVLSS